MAKSKGEKYVIKLLRERSADSAQSMFAQKEVFFDALDEVQKIMRKMVEEDTSKSIEVLDGQINGLSKKYEKVDDALRGVIKTTEFDID